MSVVVEGVYKQTGQADVVVPLAVDQDGLLQVSSITGLSIPEHDYISLTYTTGNLTGVVYKTGGATGTTVGTLTLAYDGSNNLISVTKS